MLGLQSVPKRRESPVLDPVADHPAVIVVVVGVEENEDDDAEQYRNEQYRRRDVGPLTHQRHYRAALRTAGGSACSQTARGRASGATSGGSGDYFSGTMVKDPDRPAGRTTHPEFRVTLQPSPRRVVPSSGPVTGTESVDPSAARKTPPLAFRLPHRAESVNS